MPILYYLPISPPCRAVLLLGRMLNIKFDLKIVNPIVGENMKKFFTQINPQHCIPTLDDGGFILWESRVILTYLVNAYGEDDSLYPNSIAAKAIVDQYLQFDLGTLYRRTADYFFLTMFTGVPLNDKKKSKLDESLDIFEKMLKGKKWCATDNFTIADLTLCVTVSQIEAFKFDLGLYPRIMSWLKRCKIELEPYGYKEINQAGADVSGEMFLSKLKRL